MTSTFNAAQPSVALRHGCDAAHPEDLMHATSLPSFGYSHLSFTAEHEKALRAALANRLKNTPVFTATALDGSVASLDPRTSPTICRQYTEKDENGNVQNVDQEICVSFGKNVASTTWTTVTVKEKSMEKYVKTLLPNRRLHEEKWKVDAKGTVDRTSKLTLRNGWTIDCQYEPGCKFTTIRKDGAVQLATHTTSRKVGDQIYYEARNVDGSSRTLVVGGQLFGPMISTLTITRCPYIAQGLKHVTISGTFDNGTSYIQHIIDGPWLWHRSGLTTFPAGKGCISTAAHCSLVGGVMAFSSSISGSTELGLPMMPAFKTSTIHCTNTASAELGGAYRSTATCATEISMFGNVHQRSLETSTWESNPDGSQSQTDTAHIENPFGTPSDEEHLDAKAMGCSDQSTTLKIDPQGEVTASSTPIAYSSNCRGKSDTTATERENEETSGPGDVPTCLADEGIGLPNSDDPDNGPTNRHALETGPVDRAFTALLNKLDVMLSGNHLLMVSSTSKSFSSMPVATFATISGAMGLGNATAIPLSALGESVSSSNMKIDLTAAFKEPLRDKNDLITRFPALVSSYMEDDGKMPDFAFATRSQG